MSQSNDALVGYTYFSFGPGRGVDGPCAVYQDTDDGELYSYWAWAATWRDDQRFALGAGHSYTPAVRCPDLRKCADPDCIGYHATGEPVQVK